MRVPGAFQPMTRLPPQGPEQHRAAQAALCPLPGPDPRLGGACAAVAPRPELRGHTFCGNKYTYSSTSTSMRPAGPRDTCVQLGCVLCFPEDQTVCLTSLSYQSAGATWPTRRQASRTCPFGGTVSAVQTQGASLQTHQSDNSPVNTGPIVMTQSALLILEEKGKKLPCPLDMFRLHKLGCPSLVGTWSSLVTPVFCGQQWPVAVSASSLELTL